mgnify:CR=1 FL=1
MREHIGQKIKRIRDNHNLSQDRFGKKIGLSGKTISAYETGRTNPPIKILQKIVAVYKTQLLTSTRKQKPISVPKLNIFSRKWLV